MAQDEPMPTALPEVAADAGPDDDLPPGSHALEVAARRGFGPLSAAADRVWHGDGAPCVTCGQLVTREALQCEHCGQDLRPEMVERMRAHAGPWFVLEHLRPFPGVSLERIIRQIRRGLITETSIVRGPATDYQWRFAVETPGLCLYFERCWHCHHAVTAAEVYCPACLSHLSLEPARPSIPPTAPKPNTSPPVASVRSPVAGGAAQSTGRKPGDSAVTSPIAGFGELNELANAVKSLETLPSPTEWDATDAGGPSRTGWIVAAALVVTVALLLAVVRFRSQAIAPAAAPPTVQTQS